MKRVRTKYTLRKDGRICRTETIAGKRVYFYGKSDEEVDAKFKAYIDEANKPVLMRDIIDKWWDKTEPEISPNTISGYLTAKKRIFSKFGDYPVADITPQVIIAYLEEYKRLQYSQKVISNTKSVLKQILDEAIISGDIIHNPCIGLPIVKGQPKKQREPATDDDIKKIVQYKADFPVGTMFYLMLYTGLRRGEAIALQHKHIDRQNNTITVTQSCAWNNQSKPVLKEPKTAAGKRVIHCPQFVLDVIPAGDPDDYIFFNPLPIRKTTETAIDKYREITGISCTPHQLRHKYASILHSAGIDVKDAQYLLGHSDIAITQNIYTHLEEKHKAAVANQIDNYLLSENVVKTAENK